MAGFVARKITVFSIFFYHQTIALVTLNNVLECCHFFIHLRYIQIFFYFRIDGQSSVQFSEYAKSANLGRVPFLPPNTPPPYGPVPYVMVDHLFLLERGDFNIEKCIMSHSIKEFSFYFHTTFSSQFQFTTILNSLFKFKVIFKSTKLLFLNIFFIHHFMN